MIASQLVGASKIIKTISIKRTGSKQVGLPSVVKQEQMVKSPNEGKFSNTLGQAKPEFSGMEAALGGDMMLAQEELNGNSQKQNLFFGDRSAFSEANREIVNVHFRISQSIQADTQSSREVPVRSDMVNRLAQAGADLSRFRAN